MHIFHCLIIIQILIEPVLPFKQAEHMLLSFLFLFFIIIKNMFLMSYLLVYLCSKTHQHCGALLPSWQALVCIQLAKQFGCSGMDRALGYAIILNQ